MSPTRTSDSWFSETERPALLDFWAIYAGCYDEMQQQLMEPLRIHRTFGPLLAAMSPEQQAAQNLESRTQLTRAIEHGDWGGYVRQLRSQGETYAALGVSFRDWYDVTRLFERYLTPKIVAVHGADPARMIGALGACRDFIDHAMTEIGQSYIDARSRALAESEQQLSAKRIQAVELEARNLRLQEATRLKSEFLANMSHELRTPLNAIIGFSELLHDGRVTEPEQQKDFLGDILASGQHLLQLINDVLDLSKVEAGKLEFFPEVIDLGRVIGEVTSILRTTAATKQIQVSTQISPALGEVFLDAARFKQVLYNYLSNALKFTPNGGKVWVQVEPAGPGRLRLVVADNGIGIAPADQAKLFIEFQQLEGGSAKKYGGTGLGLALTKRLVEAQGGTVGVTSERGAGSQFQAILPCSIGTARLRTASVALPSRPRTGAPLVLVVEDDDADRQTIAEALCEAGYDVEVAGTGAEAIAQVRAHAFAAITLDLILPDMSGLDVLRTVQESRNRHVPVVVITVVAERATGGFAVTDVLAKPLAPDNLVDTLRRAGVVAPPATVFVVDDDPSALKLMSEALSQLRYRPVCFGDGASALRELAAQAPTAIILDLVMPELDGFEFLSRLRRSPAHRDIPVIVWTTKDLTNEDLVRLRSTAQAVLRKGAPDIVEALRAHLPVKPRDD